MKTLDTKRNIIVLCAMIIYILKRFILSNAIFDDADSIFYYLFFDTGIREKGYVFSVMIDFVLVRCIIGFGFGNYFRTDILEQFEMIVTRENKKRKIYIREVLKLSLNVFLVYAIIYAVIQMLLNDKSIRAADIFIGYFTVLFFVLVINAVSILCEIKYIIPVIILAQIVFDTALSVLLKRDISSYVINIYTHIKYSSIYSLLISAICIGIADIVVILAGSELFVRKEMLRK